MISEVSIPLLGGPGRIYQPDALDGVAGSPETFTCIARTKRFAPFGPNGDGVGKRAFVQVTHDKGCALSVIPLVDSKEQPILERFFGVPAPHALRRESFMVPLGRPFNGYVNGLRGTAFGVEIRVANPTAQFHIESLTLEAEPQGAARGRKTTD